MKDALGAVQSVLVLGGSSDIAVATVKKLASARTEKVVLAGHNPDNLKQAQVQLEAAGVSKVSTTAFDALDFASHEPFVSSTFDEHGSFDLVLVCFGLLGNQEHDETHPLDAVKVVEANYTGAVSVLLPLAQRMKQQGRGDIVVLSSVAGERARAANFIYGSSKAGLDAFCQGLGDALVGSGVKVMVVRPGFVETKMTSHMGKKPMSTTADAVAQNIVDGLTKGREIVWAPAKLRAVASVMRLLPRPLFRRIKQ
jgi:decaprenylphospho-beta-D-erythro-pentofuranosid-2-ulose 2-reductase